MQHHSLNVCASQHLCAEPLIPRVIALNVGGSEEAPRLNEAVRVGSDPIGLTTLEKVSLQSHSNHHLCTEVT